MLLQAFVNIFSPICGNIVEYLWIRVTLGSERISHQENEQSSRNLDSSDRILLPRAAGTIEAGLVLVYMKLCSIHLSHYGDVKLEMS